jgi:hypothetical protein
MKYQAPYGSPGGPNDEAAVWINGNPTAGIEGSIPPAQAFEYPLRELIALIKAGSIIPSDSDLAQLLRSTRSQVPSYLDDTGVADALACSYVTQGQTGVPLSGYTKGMTVRVKVKVTNTGPATINIDSQGNVPIRRGDGGQLTASEIPAGAILELVHDGTNFQLISQTQRAGFLGIIDTNITKTIYGTGADFASLEGALYWVSRYMISQTGFVTFQFAQGQFTIASGSLVVDHPNATRIAFRGATGYTQVTGTDFSITGSSGVALSNDQAQQLTMLRGKYRTELRFTTASSIACVSGSTWTGVLISGDGSQDNYHGAWLFTAGNNVKLTDVSVHGGGCAGILFSGGGTSVQGAVSCSGCVITGVGVFTQMSNAGKLIACSNGQDGIQVVGGAIWIYSPTAQPMWIRGNGNHGLNIIKGLVQSISASTISNNNRWGVANIGGLAQLQTSVVQTNGAGAGAGGCLTSQQGATIFGPTASIISNTGADIQTSDAAYALLTGTNIGNMSPVANTVGNGNSYNFV